MTGPVFGLLDQNLAKLALLVPPGTKATREQVQEIVGGWRGKSIWELVDAAAGGERPRRWPSSTGCCTRASIRWRWSARWRGRCGATRPRRGFFSRRNGPGRKMPLREALTQAGFRDWPIGSLAAAEKRLIQLGRKRAGSFTAGCWSWIWP